MGLYIPYIENHDPLTEGDRTWVDRSQMYASSRYKQIQQDSLHSQAKLDPQDKFEFTRPSEEYQIERGIMSNSLRQVYEESLAQYQQDERVQAEMSTIARTNYQREIGQKIDLTA